MEETASIIVTSVSTLVVRAMLSMFNKGDLAFKGPRPSYSLITRS